MSQHGDRHASLRDRAGDADGLRLRSLEPPPGPLGEPGHEHDGHCGCGDDRRTDRLAELLVRSLERRPQRVRDVDIKKVIVEIELEDDC